MQTHAQSGHAALFPMSLHDFDHIDLEDFVFLVSSISSGSYILCASLSIQCAEAFDGDGFDGDTSF